MEGLERQKEIHPKLAKVVAALFESKDYPVEVQQSAVESFTDNLYKILQHSMDISVTTEKLDEYKEIDPNDAIAQIRYITNLLDNYEAYTLLNYYLVKVIKAYVEDATDQQRAAALKILQEQELKAVDVDEVDNRYEQLVDSSSQISHNHSMDTTNSSTLDEKEKDNIGKKLIVKLAESVDNKSIGTFEAQFVSKQIIKKLKQISTKDEMRLYIEELNSKWPLFEDILALVGQKQESEQKEKQEMQQVRSEIASQVNKT